MKKFMTILIGLMLTTVTFAQPGVWIERLSEAEIDRDYIKYDGHYTTTVETYVKLFIDKYGVDRYHFVINAIENGTIANEIQILKDKGINNDFIDAVHTLKYVDSIKTCFVANGKLYVLTYQPIENNRLTDLVVKKIRLYRRDDDSMRIASNVIRKDLYVKDKYVKQLMINSNDNESIYRFADSLIVFVTKTSEWIADGNGNYNKNYYNTVMLLISDGNGGYRSAYFEPENKIVFDVNQVSSIATSEGLTLTYEAGTIIFKIVNGDVSVDGSSTIKLSRER